MLRETAAAVQKSIDANKTRVSGSVLTDPELLKQMKAEKILEPWAKWSGDFVNQDTFIETLFNSLTNHPGQFVKHN